MKQSAIPYLAMVCLQLAYVGSNFLCKAALDEGMSIFVFVLYRHIIAMSILGPFAYYQERERRPRLTVSTTMKLSFLALIGITFQQNVHYAGLRYATPTVASALNNLIPAVTFVMAVLFRMETVSIHSLHGQAKVFGTLVCIGGALIFTFWKGVVFKGFQISMFNIYRATPVSQRHDWIKGSALLTTSYIAFCSYLVFQAAIYREFPAPLSMTALVCSFSSLQALVVALAFERHSSAWRLSWNLQLITIIYCGTIMSIVFAEQLPLGSLVGAIIIIIGLYCVLWGKSSDTKVGIDEEMADKEVTESKTSSFCSTDSKPTDPVAVIK